MTLKRNLCRILLPLLFFCGQTLAQNLVLNGGFEDYYTCPDNYDQLNRCIGAFNPCLNSSSDYYNICVQPYTSVSVPLNDMGYQQPKDGEGYAGIHLTAMDTYREYIQLKFRYPLLADTTYRLSFYFSRANTGRVVSHDLGAVFTSDSVYYADYLWQYFEPQWHAEENPVWTDTANWIHVSGDYKASGGEQWVIIGSFTDNPSLEFIYPGSMGNEYMYLYIDGVSVKEKYTKEWVSLPNVFTPDGNGINDVFHPMEEPDVTGNVTMRVLNRWGECVFNSGSVSYQDISQLSWDGTFEGKPCTEGVYFYSLESVSAETGLPVYKNGEVQLIR